MSMFPKMNQDENEVFQKDDSEKNSNKAYHYKV